MRKVKIRVYLSLDPLKELIKYLAILHHLIMHDVKKNKAKFDDFFA